MLYICGYELHFLKFNRILKKIGDKVSTFFISIATYVATIMVVAPLFKSLDGGGWMYPLGIAVVVVLLIAAISVIYLTNKNNE